MVQVQKTRKRIKQRPKLNWFWRALPVYFVVAAIAVWILVLWSTRVLISRGKRPSQNSAAFAEPAQNLRSATVQQKPSIGSSEWEGWQPVIQPMNTSSAQCTWRHCFAATHSSCLAPCREEEDSNQPPPLPPSNWVPDVEILHQMFLKGESKDGRPWPPPLPDELCETIGVAGEPRGDINKELMDAVPISPIRATMEPYPRIFCTLYTTKDSHPNRIRAIRDTWASACHGFLAFSTESDPRIPAISIPHEGKEEYNNMWQKSRSMWEYIGTHYVDHFDYFYIGGDDLFVIPQNLQAYLASLPGKPSETHYFVGRRFRSGGDNFFNSGGAGYAMSQKTLRELHKVMDDPMCAPTTHSAMEDVFIAQCLRRKLGIGLTDTRDGEGRERFHPFSPGTHYTWKPPRKGESDWYEQYNRDWGVKLGPKCCAPDSVSFHYIKKPAMMRHLYKYLYECNRTRKT